MVKVESRLKVKSDKSKGEMGERGSGVKDKGKKK